MTLTLRKSKYEMYIYSQTFHILPKLTRDSYKHLKDFIIYNLS